MVAAARCYAAGPTGPARNTTSDLSIDEVLMLHSAGWEALDLVTAVSIRSVPYGVWNWGVGEILHASAAEERAMSSAIAQMERDCSVAGGHGVVGVEVEVRVNPHHVSVELVGTAVRPVGAKALPGSRPFVSDLSARDFALLKVAGWLPVGLAHGASYVYAPRRGAGAMMQVRQNMELTNFTQALFSSRESAMERMQSTAIACGGTGVVEVKIIEGPMGFAHHAVRFSAWGTAVRLERESHQRIAPNVVLPLDDVIVEFEATSL
jgi:uncharacterized protein YbjQ (UPF0145 family)